MVVEEAVPPARGIMNIPKPRPPPAAPLAAALAAAAVVEAGAVEAVEVVEVVVELQVYDFDGTLVNTPVPEVGMAQYLEATGVPWPFQGWWGRKESLEVGPARHCSPRHRVPFNSRNEGSRRVG